MQYGAGYLRSAPFVRIIIPFISGILLQYQVQFSSYFCSVFFTAGILLLSAVALISSYHRYRLRVVTGVFVSLLFVAFGTWITSKQDKRQNKTWLGNFYNSGDILLLSLEEPLTEKPNSYKARAEIRSLLRNGKYHEPQGYVILYFRKDSSSLSLGYGSCVIIKKELQGIKNSGNPGAFDYKRYCEFQGISHQVYLTPADYTIAEVVKKKKFREWIFMFRKKILNVLSQYIGGTKELGLAEALLIGYKDDLDKDLVRAYSNTGVVHVIAISGLHLGLIYWLLVQFFKPLRKTRSLKWLSPLIIIIILWLFSFLSGAQASVLRSAMMFSCIVIGENISRQTNIYNTLAFSAFALLCYNPFWLWDIGFQLSYAAVLSIIVFMKPIYDTIYIKNKCIDLIWKLNAVTLSAQLFTLPVMLYHFHQFPVFFLLTNLIAVPLSSLILLFEIALCLFFFIPSLAIILGDLISKMIWFMNTYIERVDMMPVAVWEFINIDLTQTILLFVLVSSMGIGLLKKQNTLLLSLILVLVIIIIRTHSFVKAGNQQMIIVYNIPKVMAVDFVNGTRFLHISDTSRISDDLFQFHIRPSRILHRNYFEIDKQRMKSNEHLIRFESKKIILVDGSIRYSQSDVMIITGSAMPEKNELRECRPLIVIISTGAQPLSVKKWKEACDQWNIPYYDVREKGAFVMNMRDTTFAALISQK